MWREACKCETSFDLNADMTEKKHKCLKFCQTSRNSRALPLCTCENVYFSFITDLLYKLIITSVHCFLFIHNNN